MNYELFKSLNSVRVLDGLYGVVLCLAAGHELEGGFAAQVLELLTGRPADVHRLDVAGAEFFSGLGGGAGKFAMEFAEVAQAHLVACEQEFLETRDSIGQDARDSTLRERAVVLGDVIAELFERHLLAVLRHAIGLGVRDVGFFCAGLGAHNGNGVINHNFLVLGVSG